MKINKVTISGADDAIAPAVLMQIQEKYPFVEWGILVSRKREGESRYPTKQWRKQLHYDLNISYHLCGEICREFVAGNFGVVSETGLTWKRVQLNFNFNDMMYLPNLSAISEMATHHPYKSFILPYTKGSKPVMDNFIFKTLPDHIDFLYDSSGGRGRFINEIKAPLTKYTGYAGGINPDNVESVCRDIILSGYPDMNCWIDMETGVRTDNKFDVKKVNEILSFCEKFIS